MRPLLRGGQRPTKRSGTLFVLTGPSGSGKTTLARAIINDRELKGKIRGSVSFTTRPRRPNERQGKDYFFITEKEFRQGRRSKKILEWTRYLGYYYGTAKKTVDDQLRRGKSLVLCLDIRGARRIRRLYPRNSVLVFILPPSIKELERRITKRCKGTSREELTNRLARAREEIKEAGGFDYRIKNRDLDVALGQLKDIVTERRS
ncbi:MAG: guanylate kinase [Deltaproteobacteria bacterium]